MAFFAEYYDQGFGMGKLGWAIVVVIVINGSFSFWQAYRTEQVLAALKILLPDRVLMLPMAALMVLFEEGRKAWGCREI